MQNLEFNKPLEKGADINPGHNHSFYVGLVVMNNKGQVLLGKRTEDGIWTGPGGGSEKGESHKETAVREAFEEAQLEVDATTLIELDTIIAGDGKKVYCFLYYTGQKQMSPALDPDEEVKKWTWYDQKDIPKDLIKDSNRHTAVINGLMTFKGLKKAQESELLTILKGGQKAAIGAVHDGMQKIAEGKWVPVKEAKPQNADPASDSDANHHQDEAQRHMGEAAKYKELAAKLKEKIKHRKAIDPNYKVPGDAQTLLDEAESKAKIHTEDFQAKNKTVQSNAEDSKGQANADTMKDSKEKKTEKNKMTKLEEGAAPKDKKSIKKGLLDINNILKGRMQIAMQDHEKKEQYKADKLKEGNIAIARPDVEVEKAGEGKLYTRKELKARVELKKTLIDMGQGSAIDTADHAKVTEASNDWLPQFQELMNDYSYGDSPRSINLSNGYSIMMTKVDDGQYSGYITQNVESSEELPETVGKVDRQSLADTIQYLKAKEYIMPPRTSREIGEAYARDMDAAGAEIARQDDEYMNGSMSADGLANSLEPPQAVESIKEPKTIKY